VRTVCAALSPDSPWFWIVTGAGTIGVTAIGRWFWMSLTRSFREWVREPVKKAEERASVAAIHATAASESAVRVEQAVGARNGHGDLMTMVTRLVTNQQNMFDWQRNMETWRATQEAQARDLRRTVSKINDHLGL
jgi:hypothetical protein